MSRPLKLSNAALTAFNRERKTNPLFVTELVQVARGEASALAVAQRLRVSVDDIKIVSGHPDGPSSALGSAGAGATLRAFGFFEVLGEAKQHAANAMQPGAIEASLGQVARWVLPAKKTSVVDAEELAGIEALLDKQSPEGKLAILADEVSTLGKTRCANCTGTFTNSTIARVGIRHLEEYRR